MRLALLTDLHSNREALSACLEHAEGQQADQYAFLGDLVGYGADPAWVLDTVMAHARNGAHVLMGNHDIAMLEPPSEHMNPKARQVIEWTRAQLGDAHLAFLRSLPYQVELGDILLVHANAWAPAKWEYIDGVLEATRSMMATRAQVTFCGHIHVPALYHLTQTLKTGHFRPAADEPIPLSRQRRWLAIPGSAGQPRDGNPAAAYALYDTEKNELSFFRVPYDHDSAAWKILDAGLPPGLADRLRTGG